MLIRFPWLPVGDEQFGWQEGPVVIVNKSTNIFGLIQSSDLDILLGRASQQRVWRTEPRPYISTGLISQATPNSLGDL